MLVIWPGYPLVIEHGNKKKHVKFDDFGMYPGVE